MNGIGKYLKLGLLLLFGFSIVGIGVVANSAMNSQDDKKEETQIYTYLRSLSRLKSNYSRDIKEFDESNDEGQDTLRWSDTKTSLEVQKLLKELLQQRVLLRTQESKSVAVQSRVERWDFPIREINNLYANLLSVLGEFYNLDDQLEGLVKEELDQALASEYYPEALWLIRETSIIEPKEYASYFSRFGSSVEGYMLRLYDIEWQYKRDLKPLERQIDWTPKREIEEKWAREMANYDQQIQPLLKVLSGSPYSGEARRIANTILGNKFINIQAKVIDVEQGLVELKLFGLASTAIELSRNIKQPLRTCSPGIIREKVEDRLPNPGYYDYYINAKEDGKIIAQSSIRYNKIAVSSYQVEGDKTRVQVVDCISGNPVPDVVVYTKGNYDRLTIGYQKTNKEGFVTLPHKSKSYWVSVEDSRLAEPERIYISQLPSPASPRKYTAVEFYTDRPLYRRGQEIKVGIVAYESEGATQSTLPNFPLTIRFVADKRAEEVEIDSQKCTTNESGVVELSFKIPEDQELDNFRFENANGSEYIQVEEYQRSYLTVSIDSLPRGYVMGHPLVVKGRTTDLNGLPTPAKVQLRYKEGRIEIASGNDGFFTIVTPPIKEFGYEVSLIASDALGHTAVDSHYIYTDSTDMPLDASRVLTEFFINKNDFTITTKSQPYCFRKLGSILESRQIFAELISDKNQAIPLGTLPVNDEYPCSLPELPSGMYKIRIYTTDGYDQPISSTSDSYYYFYNATDTKLYAERGLFVAQPTNEPQILLGSSYPLTLSILLYREGKVVYQEFITCKARQIEPYSLPIPLAEEIRVSTVWQGIKYSEAFQIKGSDKKEQSTKPHIEGLDFPEPLLPSTPLQKTIKIFGENGKLLKNAPVIVTVFDKAVADAAGDSDFWNMLSGPTYDFLYGNEFLPMLRTKSLALTATDLAVSEAKADELVGARAPNNTPKSLRTNFVETAYFSALLQTNDEGEVEMTFTLPDTQTKYITKVYAFTTDLKEQCMEEATFEGFSPLSIELSTPRFLVWGDTLQGEAMIRNNGDTALATSYTIKSDSTIIATGEVSVAPKSTATCPFTVTAPEANELRLQAYVSSDLLSDGVERVIPLESNQSTYIVAQPISLYRQYSTQLQLPKVDQASSPLMLQMYLDPIQLLLSKLALAHRYDDLSTFSLFGTLHYYYVYRQLQTYLNQYPDSRAYFARVAPMLSEIDTPSATYLDRIADPKSLAAFYSYIADEKQLSQDLATIEKRLEQYIVPSGGFRYSNDFYGASPWLTHYILSTLAGLEVESAPLAQHLKKSIQYLERELLNEKSYYKDVLGFSLLAAEYHHPLPEMPSSLRKQIEGYRKHYQTASTHILLRYARYAKVYESLATYREVLNFIKARSQYTRTDDEKLSLMFFLAEDQQQVTDDLVEFVLKVKQNSLWYNSAIVDCTQLMLHHLKPTQLTDKSEVRINGVVYTLTPTEQITGAFSRECPTNASQLTIELSEVESDYVFGGVSYDVTQPSVQVTPTGEQLKVTKELYVRKVNAEGKTTFERADHVVKGDRLIVRYLLESAQDLSLVELHDARPATSQFGYDFSGYRITDRLWWEYSRRDTHDRIYIDYLPRGRHLIELEAIATNSGHFTYGPATIQSYYAPEYAGNSAGGDITVQADKVTE